MSAHTWVPCTTQEITIQGFSKYKINFSTQNTFLTTNPKKILINH